MRKSVDAAHTEDGYTRIANKLLEAMLSAGLSSGQFRTLMALARMTYGWGRKEITVSNSELAKRAGAAPSSGSFREELQELIAEGVIDRALGGQSKPSTLRINKEYGNWGRFSSTEAGLREVWDRDFDGHARPSNPARKQASPKTGIPENRIEGRPKTGIESPSNSSSDAQLAKGKERKKSLRGERVRKESFVSAFGADYKEVVKGLPPYARIGVAVNSLCAELSITPEEVRPAWQTFLRSPEQRFGPQYFAQNYGKYAPSSSVNTRTARLKQQGYV